MSWGGDELLWEAVEEAVKPIAQFEKEYDSDKLQKKIRDHFKKGAKGLEFHKKTWDELINDYADAVFSCLVTSLGERDWLYQADFLLTLDAGIKDMFPAHVLAHVPKQAFEQCVLHAYERAFEEQRILPVVWEDVQRIISAGKIGKKIHAAVGDGLKEALNAPAVGAPGVGEIEAFLNHWIDGTIRTLAEVVKGEVEWCLSEENARKLFHSLVEGGCLPRSLVEQNGQPPPGWTMIDETIRTAYGLYDCTAAVMAAAAAASAKGGKSSKGGKGGKCKSKGVGKGWGGKAPGGKGWGGDGAGMMDAWCAGGGGGGGMMWGGGMDAWSGGQQGGYGKDCGKGWCGKGCGAQGFDKGGGEDWSGKGCGAACQGGPYGKGCFQDPAAQGWSGWGKGNGMTQGKGCYDESAAYGGGGSMPGDQQGGPTEAAAYEGVADAAPGYEGGAW